MKKIFGFTFNVCLSMLVFALLLTSCVRKKHDLGKVITKEIKVTPFQDLSLFSNSFFQRIFLLRYWRTIRLPNMIFRLLDPPLYQFSEM